MPAAIRNARHLARAMLCAILAAPAVAQPAAPEAPKPASEATRAASAAVARSLPFADRKDFEDARLGLIESPATLSIPRDDGARTAWEIESFRAFIRDDAPAPESVNPSLWRMAQLNMMTGLFRVTDRIFQVRNYDISNITFVRGDTGWIVFDPLISAESARAAYALVSKHFGPLPIRAVVYSHSHLDHFGGVRGIVDEADVRAGRIAIIAPEGFTEHAIAENVIAGNAMSRRAIYMYGALLPVGPRGAVTAGLGQRNSNGTSGLIVPTRLVERTGEEILIDGVRMVFQMTPGTEAPAEMNTWFPQWRALWMAENTTHTMHNVLTLRGALVRDPKAWAYFIDETIRLWGAEAEVKFQSHHWPRWGNARVIDYLEKQRDLYKFIHDQSVRLMNMGLTGPEIAETIRLPSELEQDWAARGYYGTLKHNSRAVYQRYMGWYDGNPANLDILPPAAAAKRYVDYMGGADAVLARARADFARGDYRWVAEALKHVVFAEPGHVAARALLADTLEQLGYQAESGAWRSVYLQGAFELRNGVPKGGSGRSAAPDIVRAMTPAMLFDLLAVRLNPERAAGKRIAVNMRFSDTGESHGLRLSNSVLNHGPAVTSPDATLTLSRETLSRIQLGELKLADAIGTGAVRIEGRADAVRDLFALFEEPPFWFDIVAPGQP